ncbi:MFS family permease [Bacillus mesophilus]|uniref:Multidrug efflux MFS transporter n=1 Tax=Bacillus mesophilus TaxID=1808955 RepID=A0A6M0QAQ9_9BACI|nr:MFS transporter [Bacillus mesophilus]MBM7662538.1 MFS family permease [Bacillus mesophilus]NEY72839.1 multidrug efflux MFS transporter [Bacillus mesophilus]
MTEKEMAKRNLYIMWFANFFIAGSMTMVLPFLSLYIETFGDFSPAYVQHWSGWTFGITFVTAFIFSPIWGRLGDQYGRKRILIFTSTLLGISIFLMGFVNSVGELFFLRLFMGVCTGFISLSQAYISTQTPKEIAGRVMGTLQTGSITGALFGPMIGGVLADSIGFSATFQSVAIFIFISAVLVTLTKEYKIGSKAERSKRFTRKEVLAHIARNPVLVTVLFISILVQVAHFSIQPILSLYVSELHGPENIAFFSGVVFSAAGLGNLMMSRRWGSLADNIGYIKVLIILLIIAAVVYLPGAFVTNIWQLTIIRFFLGIAIGGIVPVRIAYIRQEAPISMQGEVLGYNTSLRFFGNIIGPFMGGMISAYFGFSAVFFITSGLLFVSAVVLYVAMNRHLKVVDANQPVKQSG